jgi:hypothetical protein
MNLRKGRVDEGVRTLQDGVLRILCDRCDQDFDIGMSSCLGCIIESVHELGRPSSIVVSNGLDRELPRDAYSMVCGVTDSLSWCNTVWKGRGRCASCRLSPSSVMDVVWGDLPDGGIREAKRMLESSRKKDERCTECIRRTLRSVERSETGLHELGGIL